MKNLVISALNSSFGTINPESNIISDWENDSKDPLAYFRLGLNLSMRLSDKNRKIYLSNLGNTTFMPSHFIQVETVDDLIEIADHIRSNFNNSRFIINVEKNSMIHLYIQGICNRNITCIEEFDDDFVTFIFPRYDIYEYILLKIKEFY